MHEQGSGLLRGRVDVVVLAGLHRSTIGRGGAKARGVTDGSASDKAEAAVATLADLGAGWTQYQNAGGTQKIDKQDCTIKAGSGFKASDTGYAGAMYRDATETMFAYSGAIVFRNKADAKTYTKLLATPAVQACKVAQDNAAEQKRNSTTFVKIKDTAVSAVGAPRGLEAFYSEYGGSKNADGTETLGVEYLRYTYRHGRIVYNLAIDTSLPTDQAATAALSDRLAEVAGSMNSAIEVRLTAAGI